MVEPIKPRHYSIASAQAAVGDSIHLLIVTVDWKTPSGSHVTDSALATSRPQAGAKVYRFAQAFRDEASSIDSQPIIMAGLGTGAAPFRAFIQARAHKKAQGIDVGPLVYYFGSRYRSSEYLYGEELEAYTKTASSSTWVSPSPVTLRRRSTSSTRFSKTATFSPVLGPEIEKLEAAGGKAEVVLQDGLINDEDVEDGKKGYFFVCGPTWPVPDIHEALVGAFVKKGLTKDQAEKKMEASRRTSVTFLRCTNRPAI